MVHLKKTVVHGRTNCLFTYRIITTFHLKRTKDCNTERSLVQLVGGKRKSFRLPKNKDIK